MLQPLLFAWSVSYLSAVSVIGATDGTLVCFVPRSATRAPPFESAHWLRHTRVLARRGEPRSSPGQRIASLPDSGGPALSSSLPASLALVRPPPPVLTRPHPGLLVTKRRYGCCLLHTTSVRLLSLRAPRGTSSKAEHLQISISPGVVSYLQPLLICNNSTYLYAAHNTYISQRALAGFYWLPTTLAADQPRHWTRIRTSWCSS